MSLEAFFFHNVENFSFWKYMIQINGIQSYYHLVSPKHHMSVHFMGGFCGVMPDCVDFLV